MNRRRLLAIVATSTTTIAGCNYNSGQKTHRVSTDGEIRKQQTDDHPPVIRFSLTNESDDPLTLSSKRLQPFVYFPRLANNSDYIVCIPTTDNDINWDVAQNRTNGCWRFVDADGNRTDMDIHTGLDRLTLQPGRTHSVTHHLYYESDLHYENEAHESDVREENETEVDVDPEGGDRDRDTTGECFPDGEYNADHTILFHESENKVTFNVILGLSDGRLSSIEVHRYKNQEVGNTESPFNDR